MPKKFASMRRIAFLGQKGGVGKTTFCVSIYEWLLSKGQRVRLLDGNAGQRTITRWAELRAQNGVTPIADVTPTWKIEGPKHRQVLVDCTAYRLAEDFDGFTLLDLPGDISDPYVPALSLCDDLVIPIQCKQFDYQSLVELLALLPPAAELRAERKQRPWRIAMVMNEWQPHIRTQQEIRRQLTVEAKQRKIPILKTEWGLLSDHYTAQMIGRSAVSYFPEGKAARQIDSLARELELLHG